MAESTVLPSEIHELLDLTGCLHFVSKPAWRGIRLDLAWRARINRRSDDTVLAFASNGPVRDRVGPMPADASELRGTTCGTFSGSGPSSLHFGRNGQMKQTLRVVSALVCLAVFARANGEILNLECRRDNDDVIFSWIDFERGTITLEEPDQPVTLETYSVTIFPEAFTFTTSLERSTINMATDVFIFPHQDSFLCSQGTHPFPATKF